MCTGLGGAILGAGAIGGISSIFGSTQAAKAQTAAAKKAIQAQMKMYQKTQGNLRPWIKGGKESYENLLQTLPELQKPFNMTQAELEATPGYQFTKDQGLKGVQSGFAAKGLGTSGAAMKGAADYVTGLADKTYTDRFNQYWAQNQNRYNMLAGPATMGQNAAAGLGNAATATGQGIANSVTNSGNAQAAMWNSIGNSLAGIANTVPASMYLPGILARQGAAV